MDSDKKYIIPPDLHAKIIYFGMTVNELILLGVLFLAGVFGISHGKPWLFAPALASCILCVRGTSGINAYIRLAIILSFTFAQQRFDLHGYEGGGIKE